MEGQMRLWLHLVAVCAVCSALSDPEIAAGQRQRMHEVVRGMLGFTDSPGMPHPRDMEAEAPKYMLDLYEKFKDGPISKGHLSGNTVRSIRAKIETVNGQKMFVFNLTSLGSTDEMISAEIHMYKRRKSRYNRRAQLALVLHEVAPHYVAESDKITLNAAGYGWQWFDVTNNVQNCLAERRDNIHSLGINFESIKQHGDVNILKLKRFIHHHSFPYLVIYSNDSQTLDMDELDKISENFKVKKHILTEESDVKNNKGLLERTLRRRRRSVSDNSADLHVFPARARSRSILTNEIPENPNDYHTYAAGLSIQTHPGMLQTRKETRHRLSDSRLIPYPGEYIDKRKRKRLRNRRRKNKGRKNNALVLPKEWEDLQTMASEENIPGLCAKQKLVVDFNDIGWGEWIISPKSFKAHYCSGSCPFPLTKKLRPSNHATIQSLVNAVGINPAVPAPCCVPDKLSSITLLYFDENRNVVLKNYPNMTVQKCACR